MLIHLKRVSIQGGTVLLTCRDITDRKHAEKELATTRLELAHVARLALVGEMTASIVHEINQPLTSIQANASAGIHVARSQSSPPGAAEELCDIFTDIHAASSDAAAIVHRLRTLVRKRPLELSPTDLNGIASDVLQLVAADASRRRVTIRAELAHALPPVHADRVSLQHVLLNLVVNAMEAMNEDGRHRQVIVQTRPATGAVECAVSDNGRGISAAELPKIFDPFFSTKKDGIGLGLAIARTIVEAHSGRIWAEGHAGQGATFRVTLPVRPARANLPRLIGPRVMEDELGIQGIRARCQPTSTTNDPSAGSARRLKRNRCPSAATSYSGPEKGWLMPPEGPTGGENSERRPPSTRGGPGVTLDRDELAAGREVEKLFPVAAPSRQRTSPARGLQVARAVEGGHHDLGAAGLLRGEGQRAPVGREPGVVLVGRSVREGRQARRRPQGQDPELEAHAPVRRVVLHDDAIAVR